MYTFTALGSRGRLGNQLFQMAATIGAAIEHDVVYVFPRWQYAPYFNLAGCFYDGLDSIGLPLYVEPAFRYAPIPWYPALNLRGYFQSEKYFAHCKPTIRQLFTTPDSTIDACFIHVRRGDYLATPAFHPIQTMEYYRAAMEILRYDWYIVCSDDPAWCAEHFVGAQFELSSGRSEIEDLRLMSACTGAIIANSSFSWWGAWLGGHDNVVCSRQWFGPAGPPIDETVDLIPEAWTAI